MTARKRKSPNSRKKKPSIAALAAGGVAAGLRGLGRAASRHPAAFGGSAAFAVVFSFVAANAMWYQPGAHPSPFLRTRMPPGTTGTPVTSNGAEESRKALPATRVTTFVIEREDQLQDDGADAGGPQKSEVVLEIQKQLALRGFFEGDADGLMGPETSSAIARFERQSGRVETGRADAAMLALLVQTGETEVAAVDDGTAGVIDGIATPRERPFEETSDAGVSIDPVAAAILEAEGAAQADKRAEIPVQSEMVMEIQKGLSNIAYSDIAVDGIAGEQTKAAIRHFEKHYRLPETGTPNEKVLEKLKEIGAL